MGDGSAVMVPNALNESSGEGYPGSHEGHGCLGFHPVRVAGSRTGIDSKELGNRGRRLGFGRQGCHYCQVPFGLRLRLARQRCLQQEIEDHKGRILQTECVRNDSQLGARRVS